MPLSPRLLRPRASGTAVHPEVVDWASRVTTNGGSVSTNTLAAVSTFCASIDAAGIRDRFLRLNLFCGNSDASLAAVRTPLYRGASLTGTQLGNTTDTNVNFVAADYNETGASAGLTSDGSTKYLITGLSPSDIGVVGHASLAIASGTYKMRSSNGTDSVFGVDGTSGFFGGTVAVSVSAAGVTHTLRTVTRSSSTDLRGYSNASLAGTTTTSMTASAFASPLAVFSSNQSGLYAQISSGRYLMYSLGNNLSGAQVTSYNNAVQAFFTALGR